MSAELTTKQEVVLTSIVNFMDECGNAPTYKELATIMGFGSNNAIVHYIDVFVRKGYVVRKEGISRCISLTEKTVQLYPQNGKTKTKGISKKSNISIKDQRTVSAF